MLAMADAVTSTRGEFHAEIRAMEPGLLRSQYRGELNPEPPDARELPDFHVDTSVNDVKVWVEQMAKSVGYSRIVWDSLPGWSAGLR
jgi:hypothetical protein